MKATCAAAVLAAVFLGGCATIAGTGASLVPPIASQGLVIKASEKVESSVLPPGDATRSILACPNGRLEYVPLPALAAGGYMAVEVDGSGKATAVTKPWPKAAADVNALLTNIATNISQSEDTASGNVASIFSASHTRKQYVIDFMKWRAEPLVTTDGVQLGWVRVGAGMRLIVNVTKDDGSASGSLFALAVGAKAGKVEGSISAELIGIDAKETTQAMPFTVDLSEGNIQKVVEALAIVKAKLYDASTVVSPNLVARIQCVPSARPG